MNQNPVLLISRYLLVQTRQMIKEINEKYERDWIESQNLYIYVQGVQTKLSRNF